MGTRTKDITQRDQKPLTIVHPEVDTYQHKLLSRHDEPVLAEMEEFASARNFPIVGRIVGSFLEVMALSIRARTVFEFGSGFGYSAYWFSRAVGPQGTVICTDGDGGNTEQARQFLAKTGRIDRVQFHTGWAQEIFKTTTELFDVIYNDVDKDAYPEVWTLSKDRIRPGGLYIADNVLWGGRVALPEPGDEVFPGWTEAIKEHNYLISIDPEFDSFINPSRDGVIVARRRLDL
ncbi:MAG: O-methyltransferase [Deltaproteobacteria bacterium]|nr:O-methyltransferase [Deltaproteobacteria bacterium]